MSAWTIGNIINICLLPAYGFLLFLNTYNLWGYHIRREYVLLFMSTSCISPPIHTNTAELMGSRDSRTRSQTYLPEKLARSLFCPVGPSHLQFGILSPYAGVHGGPREMVLPGNLKINVQAESMAEG